MTFLSFMLVLGCCLCEAHSQDKVGQNSCSETCGVTSMALTVGAMGEKVINMADKITFLESKTIHYEKEILELKSLIGKPEVAFSAALYDGTSGNFGPFTSSKPLPYKKVFSNIGSAYNPATGIFTASLKGVYFFRFSMFNNLNSPSNSVVSLMKNGVRLVSVWDTAGSDINDMGSNAVVVPLNMGDNVYVELMENRLVYDDGMNYNTFSGFLLFSM